ADRNRTKQRGAGKLVKDLEAFVYHLEILSFSHLAIRVWRRAIAADPGERNSVPIENGRRNRRHAYEALPETTLNHGVGSVLVLMRYLRVEIRLMFGLGWRPHQGLFAERPRQIAVPRGDYSCFPELLCFPLLRCICLGRGF